MMNNTWSEEDPESTSSSRPGSRTSFSSSSSSSSSSPTTTTGASSSSQRHMQIFRNINTSSTPVAPPTPTDSPYSASWNPNHTPNDTLNSSYYQQQQHQQPELDNNLSPPLHGLPTSEIGVKWASSSEGAEALFNYRHQSFASSSVYAGKAGPYVHGMEVKGQSGAQFQAGTENTQEEEESQEYGRGEFGEAECKTENDEEDVLDNGSAPSSTHQPKDKPTYHVPKTSKTNKELKRLLNAPLQYSSNSGPSAAAAARTLSSGLLNTPPPQPPSSVTTKPLNYASGRYDNGNWNDPANRSSAAEIEVARSPSSHYWFPPPQAQLLNHDPLMLNNDPNSRSPLTSEHQQQQQYHHQPSSTNRRSSNEEDDANLVKFNSWVGAQSDLPIYPTGLEIVLRELPAECKNMVTPQDVPETARVRGYFTVAELTHLKRVLKSRHEERRISSGGPTIYGGNKENPAALFQQDNPTVGSAFKDAMHTLNPDQLHPGSAASTAASSPGGTHHQGSPRTLQNEQASSGCGGGADLNQGLPLDASSAQNAFMAPVHYTRQHEKSFKDKPDIYKGMSGPPPPYRTSTLVLKLLEIGHYHFRSFSDTNPNRLRVLFNTQRLAYDCQLPTLPPNPETAQPLRKILTIEVGFDQIKAMKFGTDRMQIRVDGPPFLNVSFTPSNEDAGQKNLTPEEKFLLEQIDRGQMKLSQNHSLHFLNERLVSVLENQFKEHPRLRHLLGGGGSKATPNYR